MADFIVKPSSTLEIERKVKEGIPLNLLDVKSEGVVEFFTPRLSAHIGDRKYPSTRLERIEFELSGEKTRKAIFKTTAESTLFCSTIGKIEIGRDILICSREYTRPGLAAPLPPLPEKEEE